MESMFAIIAKELGVKPGQVESAVTLLDEVTRCHSSLVTEKK